MSDTPKRTALDVLRDFTNLLPDSYPIAPSLPPDYDVDALANYDGPTPPPTAQPVNDAPPSWRCIFCGAQFDHQQRPPSSPSIGQTDT